jgi:hypothetical protein
MVVNSLAGRPRELRFLTVTEGWRWLDARVELGEVKLQRNLGQKVKLEETKVYAEGERARDFANFLCGLLDLPILGELPKSGAVALITSDDELRLQFQLMPNSDVVGPVLRIEGFRRLHGGGGTG